MFLALIFMGQRSSYAQETDLHSEQWFAVGKKAGEEALSMMGKEGFPHRQGVLIVLSNAGYAEINHRSTQPALDGLSEVTGASRGKQSLIEVHSDSQSQLWFAVYDTGTGACAYLQADGKVLEKLSAGIKDSSGLFSHRSVMRIDADYLFANVATAHRKFEEKPFDGNEFRIVTIANAVAKGAPSSAVRAFEFHDHFCPGVSSGILMASYIQQHFSRGNGSYFIHSVDPWCKEDALLVLLNTTPGKNGYCVSYPTAEDKAKWKPEAKNAATIVYRQLEKNKKWEGRVLAFEWGENSCPKTESKMIDKLCGDLWFLKQMDTTEKFVKVIKEFELPEGVSPKDWARPGVDPMSKLQLLRD